MNIEIIVQNSKTGLTYDMTELVMSDIIWETSISGQAGRLSFSYVEQVDFNLTEGSPLWFKVDGQGIFFGYIFSRGKSAGRVVPVIAYDQTRYLKNKDTYIISNMTAPQIVTKVCNDFKLKSLIVNDSPYVVPPRIMDNKNLFEIVEYGIDMTLINTGNWFMIRDNFGVIEFVSINSLKTDLFIGDESLLTDYEFKSSIDEDSYNQIKLVKENKETVKREVYIIKDSNNVKQWGLLQYFEVMDEKANEGQIKQRAETLMKLKNRVTKKLRISAIGSLKVRAGSGIVIGISDLDAEMTQNKYFMVTQCTHKFSNSMHIMDLEMQVSI